MWRPFAFSDAFQLLEMKCQPPVMIGCLALHKQSCYKAAPALKLLSGPAEYLVKFESSVIVSSVRRYESLEVSLSPPFYFYPPSPGCDVVVFVLKLYS